MSKIKSLNTLFCGVVLVLILLAGCGLPGVERFSLTILINEEDGGSIHVNPDGDTFAKGTEVKLTAVSAEGWNFDKWQGDAEGKDNQITLTMDGDKVVTAIFEINTDETTGFAGGVGTEADPYLVGTGEQLDNVRNHLNKHFKQIANIDLIGYSSGTGWEPIGEEGDGYEFWGKYNGNGFKIRNLFINQPQGMDIGLFGIIANGSNLIDISLENVDITGQTYVGGLVGLNLQGFISGCSVEGTVKGQYSVGGLVGRNEGDIIGSYEIAEVFGEERYVGGLVGDNWGEVKNCYSQGIVSGPNVHVMGGLVGRNKDGEIIDGFSTAEVSGYDGVGGLVGRNSGGLITGSFSTGNVLVEHVEAGGLVGWNNGGEISKCYSTGDVNGDGWNYLGGFAGYNDGKIIKSFASGSVTGGVGGMIGDNNLGGFVGSNVGEIMDCFATGDVTGDINQGSNVGGFSGNNMINGEITNCYSIGKVTGEGHLGGFVGNNLGIVTFSYWDIEESEIEISESGKGRTTPQMQRGTPGVFVNPDGTVDIGENPDNLIYDQWEDSIWDFGTKEEYPRLQWQDQYNGIVLKEG